MFYYIHSPFQLFNLNFILCVFSIYILQLHNLLICSIFIYFLDASNFMLFYNILMFSSWVQHDFYSACFKLSTGTHNALCFCSSSCRGQRSPARLEQALRILNGAVKPTRRNIVSVNARAAFPRKHIFHFSASAARGRWLQLQSC